MFVKVDGYGCGHGEARCFSPLIHGGTDPVHALLSGATWVGREAFE